MHLLGEHLHYSWRRTIAAQVPRAIFLPPVKSFILVVPEQQRDFLCRCGAYRIPFLWSKAGIMEVGCSDMRATTKCSTSCRFSSCREERGGKKKKGLCNLNCTQKNSANCNALCRMHFKYWRRTSTKILTIKCENRPCFCSTMQQNLNTIDHLTWSRDRPTYLMYC